MPHPGCVTLKSSVGSSKARVFILPHAGASIFGYRPFAQKFSSDIEVLGYEPKGHGLRARESFAETMTDYLQDCRESFFSLADAAVKPTALLGYSMGTLSAYELALEMPSTNLRLLMALSFHPPHLFTPANVNEQTSEGELRELIESFGGTPAPVLDSDEMRAYFFSLLRKDLALTTTFSRTHFPKISSPLFAAYGQEDLHLERERMEKWKELSSESFELKIFAGRHFFLFERTEAQNQIVKLIESSVGDLPRNLYPSFFMASSSSKAFQYASTVVQRLRENGYEALLAGGCVRDHLRGVEAKDYDVATNALPAQVQKIFPRNVPVGEAFNVVLVLSEEDPPFKVEVATFRKDIGIKDGRHPEAVAIATAQEDVLRRDFTINGMLMDPLNGEIFDWVGGQEDLKKKILRAIGEPELRIQEDFLRMLRAVRFSARLGFELEASLRAAIQKYAPHIRQISAERIFDELTRMLTGKNAPAAFNLMADLGLLFQILPEALAMKGCEQPPEFHPEGDVWVHTLLLLEKCEEASPELAWGCLLHDIGKPPTFSQEAGDRIRFNNHQNVGAEMAETILKRLKASRQLIETVCELTRDHLKFKDAPQMRDSTLKRFLRNPRFDLHLQLHHIDCMASHQNLELYRFCQQKLAELPPEKLKPSALISGGDLIALGYKPGPLFKKILETVETEQLEGRLSDKEQALAFVRSKEWFDEMVR